MRDLYINIAFYLAGNLPAAYKIYQLKDAKSQSIPAYFACLVSIIYNILFALEDNSWRAIVSQTTNFILTMITFVLIIWYQRIGLILTLVGAFLFLKIFFKNECRSNEVFS